MPPSTTDSTRTGRILILYFHNLGFPMRKTNEDMLRCFERYSNYNCYFVNAAFGIPKYIAEIEYDLIIFHDLLLCKRSLPRRFNSFVDSCSSVLHELKGPKIALVQDEFLHSIILSDFLKEHNVQHIFSVAPASEWQKIYRSIDPSKVKFSRVLTGYIGENMISSFQQFDGIIRDIDIGYRAAYEKRYSLGSFGYNKVKIADVFLETSKAFNLKTDISTSYRDAFLGAQWYRFMARCKYTLGVESGANILDSDGTIERRVASYLSEHPEADFNEVEQHCFPGIDGNLSLFAVGPRHLEACVAKTCQVLMEGEYNGILKPWEHYIPIKKDWSNVDEVLKLISSDQLRADLVRRSYQDIVESQLYTLESYVRFVYSAGADLNSKLTPLSPSEKSVLDRNERRENRIWRYIPLRSKAINLVLNNIPKSAFRKIEKFMKKGGPTATSPHHTA